MAKKVKKADEVAVAGSRQRQRLSAQDRREDILLKAIQFFAIHGFAVNTRDLAAHIGVTQPLLFRYFPSKAELVEAVFEEMYARQRRHEWEAGLSDRSRPVSDRLVEFCSHYAQRTYSYEWIRIYSFAGLLDGELNRRYIRRVTEPALRRICVEVAVENGYPERAPADVSQDELDVVWLLHGGLFYFAIRKFVYGENPSRSMDFVIQQGVRQTLETLTAYYAVNLGRIAPRPATKRK